MSTYQDIRWKRRFDNYKRALHHLEGAMTLQEERNLSSLERLGMIKAFEFTQQLAWKTLHDLLESNGHLGLCGPKETVEKAFAVGLIQEKNIWMDMILSRNYTNYVYDDATATGIIYKINKSYFTLLLSLQDQLQDLCDRQR
ncbi:MAG: HI0074 family nucleotidyltransferase substrate-binding subunit [Limnochordia bacterium]